MALPVARMTVLIVDDDLGTRETLQVVLRTEYAVLTAESAEAGLAVMEASPTDLVMLDVRLPGINGLEALRILKTSWPDTEVIMMSVIDDLRIAVACMQLGAYYYLEKNLDLIDTAPLILRNASQHLAMRRRIAELTQQLGKNLQDSALHIAQASMHLVDAQSALDGPLATLGLSRVGHHQAPQ